MHTVQTLQFLEAVHKRWQLKEVVLPYLLSRRKTPKDLFEVCHRVFLLFREAHTRYSSKEERRAIL